MFQKANQVESGWGVILGSTMVFGMWVMAVFFVGVFDGLMLSVFQDSILCIAGMYAFLKFDKHFKQDVKLKIPTTIEAFAILAAILVGTAAVLGFSLYLVMKLAALSVENDTIVMMYQLLIILGVVVLFFKMPASTRFFIIIAASVYVMYNASETSVHMSHNPVIQEKFLRLIARAATRM